MENIYGLFPTKEIAVASIYENTDLSIFDELVDSI